MATIQNVTYPAVVCAIEDVLEQCPSYPYQRAFAHPELRQQLIASVLTQSQTSFIVIETNLNPHPNLGDEIRAEYDKLQPEYGMIRGKIEVILQNQAAWIEQHIPKQQHYLPEQQKLI